MRILYVHQRAGVTGATISLALTLEALGDRVEPVVLTPRGPAGDLLGRVAEVRHTPSAGLQHIWSGTYVGRRWSLLPAHAGALPRHLAAARSHLRRTRPDVVHVNDAPQLPTAVLASRRGLPVVAHLRAALPVGEGARRSALVRHAVRRHVDVAIATNGDVAASYGSAANTVVVPNPVVLPAAPAPPSAAAKAALGLPEGLPVVALIGHLYRPKGWLELLEAVAALRREGVDVAVALAGEPLRSAAWHRTARGRLLGALAAREDAATEIAEASARLGLDDRVHVLGWRDEMESVYAAVDVVCAPSQGPEIGRSVLEAQASARPALAVSRTGGGIVRDGETGVLVPEATPARLVAALRPLLTDAGLRRRLGTAARAHAEREYAPEVVASRLLDVYDRARRARAVR